jgi:hypothetical protein
MKAEEQDPQKNIVNDCFPFPQYKRDREFEQDKVENKNIAKVPQVIKKHCNISVSILVEAAKI